MVQKCVLLSPRPQCVSEAQAHREALGNSMNHTSKLPPLKGWGSGGTSPLLRASQDILTPLPDSCFSGSHIQQWPHITQFWPARRERRSVGEGSGPAFAFPSERTDGFAAVPFLPLALNANATPKATTAILRPPGGEPDSRTPTS